MSDPTREQVEQAIHAWGVQSGPGGDAGVALPSSAPARGQVFVPGRPAPQGSKRHLGNGIMVESSKALKPWRVDVQWAVREHFTAPLEGPVRLVLEFVMPRPKSAPKRSTPPAVKRPDVDKLARAVMDAVTGVIVGDDSQVTHLVARKRIAEVGEVSGLWLTAEVDT